MPKSQWTTVSMLAAMLAAPAAAAEGGWSYAGNHGPAHWGGVCATGGQQSPIDLAGAAPARVAQPVIDWRPVASTNVVNNGHTIEAQFPTGGDAGGLVIGQTPYRLVQVHFHHQSEHAIGGRRFPLEAHFVHAADDGSLAVVGVMFEEGATHAGLDQLWTVANPQSGARAASGPVDPNAFLPPDRTALHYAGSLTTPPCSEIVAWTVYQTPLTASRAQIEAFARVFPDNARPLQPRNRRFILQTSGPGAPTG